MYDRAPRFKKIITATPENVGPSTYLLSDIFDRNIKCQCGPGSQAPFNSSSLRTIAFTNKNLIENPSPKYRIWFRKHRIVGGTSMQNLAPRFNYKNKDYIVGPDLTKEAKRLPGHIHRGVPPRNSSTHVTTIPEKGAEGYLQTQDGLVKIFNPPENKPVGPTSYYNPEGNENYTTLQYKGNFWSLRTAKRFKYKPANGPSPAEYSVNEKQISPWKKYQETLQSMKQASAPSLRHDDLVLRKLCRENLPGPGAYSPNDPNTKKCECGKGGTFSKSERGSLYQMTEGPGPASYSDPRSAVEKANKYVSMNQSPFNVNAQRFPDRNKNTLPGPSDYVPEGGLWHDVRKKEHSRYSQHSAPFDSSAYRNTAFTKSDVLCIPGPDLYNPQFQRKGDKNKSYMFASKVKRDSTKINQNLPAPNAYSAVESFKMISTKKSHLQPKDSAFLTSSERIEPLQRSYSPGPDAYDTAVSTLNTKAGVIGMKFRDRAPVITPGPPHYKVHPSLKVIHTNNITLRKKEKPKGNMKRKGKGEKKNVKEIVKKLRNFCAPYPTRHCPTDYH